MKTILSIGVCSVLSLSISHALATDLNQPNANNTPARGYIFVFKQPSNASTQLLAEGRSGVVAFTQQLEKSNNFNAKFVYSHSISGFYAPDMSAEQADKLLKSTSDIAYTVKDSKVKAIDSQLLMQAHQEATNSGPETPWGVSHVGGPKDGRGHNAWIIDTGITPVGENLNIGDGANCLFSFILGCKPNFDTTDRQGHGTFVANIIAGNGEVTGQYKITGVAQGATVHPVKALNLFGMGFTSDIIAAVDYVADKASPGDCVNMSLGGAANQALDDAVNAAANKGLWFAIAAGNEGKDAMESSPARVQNPHSYTIAAIDSKNTFADFSNYGQPPVSWAAPGVDIVSLGTDGSPKIASGTSAAAPHVCAIAMMQNKPNVGATTTGPDGKTYNIAHY